MAAALESSRLNDLLGRGTALIAQGRIEDGTRALREAAALAPHNDKVREAIAQAQSSERKQPLIQLCRRFKDNGDDAAGHEALRNLRHDSGSISSKASIECLEILIDGVDYDDAELRDNLVADLIRFCPAVRQRLAALLLEALSTTFTQIYEIGDGGANALTVVSLDPSAWPDDATRHKAENDIFVLFLAKLLQSGDAHDGRALKGISRHLAVDFERLHTYIDETSFDAILICLDYRLSDEVRSHATLATAKYLEASKDIGERYLTNFITSRTAQHSTQDLVLAFSVAAATFPLVTNVIAELFLIDGFLESLIPLLDKQSRPITVERAALDMLNAACIDRRCREAIAKHCSDWMHHVMEDQDDDRHGQAAVILAKVQSLEEDSATSSSARPATMRRASNITDVVPTLNRMLLSGTELDRRTAIEGLAYASLQPSIKEEIVNDHSLLEQLLKSPKQDSMTSAAAFGSLTLLDNLSKYKPVQTREQKSLSQLRAYANASKEAEEVAPLDDDAAVTRRCEILIDANCVSYLQSLQASFVQHKLSQSCKEIMAKIAMSLSQPQNSRRKLTQQGLLPFVRALSLDSSLSTEVRLTTALVMARILATVDPHLISAPFESMIANIADLLQPAAMESASTLLPAFEALRALTNLASSPTLRLVPAVLRSTITVLDDLLLHDNVLLRRAATELVCNLVNTEDGTAKFVSDTGRIQQRIHVLLALADAEDQATRSAAAGALAALTAEEAVVLEIARQERGARIMVGICSESEVGLVHRGLICLYNLIGRATNKEDLGGILAKLSAANASDVLRGVVTSTGLSGDLRELGTECLEMLESKL